MLLKEHDPFYDSPRWRRLRSAILKRDGYLCQLSKRYGKRVEANVVHHIFPRDKYPQYQWEPWNLISLSIAKHNNLHDRNTDDLTDEGLELLERTARLKNIPPPLNGEKKST